MEWTDTDDEAAPSFGEEIRHGFLRKRDKPADAEAAAEKVVVWQEMYAPGMQLVPMERHRRETRWQFLRGVLVGFGISALLTIAVLRYTGGVKPGGPAQRSASAAQSRPEQSLASVAQPLSSGPSASDPTAAKTLPTANTISASSPTALSQRQRPQTGLASSDFAGRASVPLASPQQAKAKLMSAMNEARAFEGSPSSIAPPETALEARSSADKAAPRKVSATPQQLWSAVQAGNMRAAVELAGLYARGDGVPVNCDQARVLLRVASEKNNREAPKKLQELDKGGCPATSQ